MKATPLTRALGARPGERRPRGLATLLVALGLLSGCSTVRSTLKPWVCDCDRPQSENCGTNLGAIAQETDELAPNEEDAPAEIDEIVLEQTDNASEDEVFNTSEDLDTILGSAEDGDDVLATATPSPGLRALARNSPPGSAGEQAAALRPVSVMVDDAFIHVSSPAVRQALVQSLGVDIPARPDTVVIKGPFVRFQDGAISVVVPGVGIRVYVNGRVVASRSFDSHDSSVSLTEIDPKPIAPVRLVDDGTLQILVHYAENREDGSIVFKASIFKIFGGEIGTILDTVLATQAYPGAPLIWVARLDFLSGSKHRFVRRTPTSGEPEILIWNRWEGYYRPKVDAPTSPRRTSARGQS